jgi:hypothetical protein
VKRIKKKPLSNLIGNRFFFKKGVKLEMKRREILEENPRKHFEQILDDFKRELKKKLEIKIRFQNDFQRFRKKKTRFSPSM